MKQRKSSWVVEMLIINMFLMLAGCTVSSPTSIPSAGNRPGISTIAVSRIPSTSTPSSTRQTPSAVPNATDMSTATSTILPITITPLAVTEIFMPIPTPLGQSSDAKVLWLLETNNGCQLPCWWGIIPGQTTWDAAKQFFNTFTTNILSASSPDLINYSPIVPLPSKVYDVDTTSPVYSVRNGIVDTIRVDVSIGDTSPGSLSQYTLSAFLATYGEPTAVWLSTHGTSPGGGAGSGGILPFVIVLFYPDQGIAALYDDLGEIEGDRVRGCPQAYPVSTLKLWSPNSDFTFEQLASSSSAFNREYLSLAAATEMNVATFYETFKNPDNITCLETPANLWP